MKKNNNYILDILYVLVLALVFVFLLIEETRDLFIKYTSDYKLLGGFFKFFVFASMGDLLGSRIKNKKWVAPIGLFKKAVVWGFIGIVIVLIFGIFGSGVETLMDSGVLPFKGSAFFKAFFISLIMNLTFAPTMMAFHRVTDTLIEKKHEGVKLAQALEVIDWKGFITFVVFKTIPLFWIPAHTLTFLLPKEFQVLFASILGICLGLLLGLAKNKK